MKLSEYKLLKKYMELSNGKYPLDISKKIIEKMIYQSFDFKCFVINNELNNIKNEILKILRFFDKGNKK